MTTTCLNSAFLHQFLYSYLPWFILFILFGCNSVTASCGVGKSGFHGIPTFLVSILNYKTKQKAKWTALHATISLEDHRQEEISTRNTEELQQRID